MDVQPSNIKGNCKPDTYVIIGTTEHTQHRSITKMDVYALTLGHALPMLWCDVYVAPKQKLTLITYG